MEIERITFHVKLNKGGKDMVCKKKSIKIEKEGRNVVPRIKKIARSDVKKVYKTYK